MTRACFLPRRRGSTLVEMLVVCLLTSLLAMLAAAAWNAIGRPGSDVEARSRIAAQATLAVGSLARDLGGFGAGASSRLGGTGDSAFATRFEPGDNQFILSFGANATTGAPAFLVTYSLSGDSLMRSDEGDGSYVTVARNVQSLGAVDNGDGTATITIAFAYRQFVKTYTLVAVDPSS